MFTFKIYQATNWTTAGGGAMARAVRVTAYATRSKCLGLQMLFSMEAARVTGQESRARIDFSVVLFPTYTYFTIKLKDILFVHN